MKEKKLRIFGKSKDGNFEIIDTIGVPHPYCISPKHIAYASDHWSGILNKDSIESAERENKAQCDICRRIYNKNYDKPVLPYSEHKTALLVACYKDNKVEGFNKELHEYLLKCKPLAEKNNYVGFAFLKKF